MYKDATTDDLATALEHIRKRLEVLYGGRCNIDCSVHDTITYSEPGDFFSKERTATTDSNIKWKERKLSKHTTLALFKPNAEPPL